MEPLVSLVAFPMIEWIVIGFSEPMDSATEVNTAIFCLCKKKNKQDESKNLNYSQCTTICDKIPWAFF